MPEEPVTTSILRPQELKAVYSISNAVSEVADVDDALDRIIHLARPVLIFDNIVVYTQRQGTLLEPSYARIIGRGRTSEDDLSWGETIALEVFQSGKTATHQERLANWKTNRLHLRYMLGLPLRSRQQVIGTLVFGRFGGPPYTSDQIHLAEFVAIHIAQLLVRQELVEQVANLEAERRLRQLQDTFIATVSHELCTPLGFIKGYATTLLRDDTSWDDGTRREFLQIIDEETDRLRDLIDNLLDSSRLQAGTLDIQIQEIRLDMLLREIVTRSAARYPGFKITWDTVKDVKIKADPMRLTQVFDNLISNAVKYAPGSPVHISLKLRHVSSSDYCQISVVDQGPGIAEEHLSRLFERFYRVPTTSEKIHGTGLGLYICQEIIRVHGGQIQVKSKLGKGTAFLILLPISHEKSKSSDSGG